MRVPGGCICFQGSSCQRLLLRRGEILIIFNRWFVSRAWIYDFGIEFVWIYWENRFIWFGIFFNSSASEFCALWQVIFYSNSSLTLEPNSTFNMISFTLLWTRYEKVNKTHKTGKIRLSSFVFFLRDDRSGSCVSIFINSFNGWWFCY